MQITTVVLDIGQVLVEFRWKEYLQELPFSQEQQRAVAEVTVANKTLWQLHDKGVYSDEEFIQECLRLNPSISKELQLFFERIREIVKEYEYASPFIKALKKAGYRVYLLSNYGKTPFQYAQEMFTFFPFVDGAIISSDVKQVKPEPDIYQTLFKTYHINPEEAVFLDDSEDNIKTARELGMKGIIFKTLDQALKELESYEIKISY